MNEGLSKEKLTDKTLLITGGTGSFGQTVLKNFLDFPLKEIRIFSRDEKKQDDLRRRYQSKKIKFFIGDVRDRSSVDSAMSGVDYVFHSAALKQVPSCEYFPLEAVKTNVLGTNNVLESAIYHGVSRVICLSTDKAVYPINAMGMSKGLMEKTVISKSRALDDNKTVVCATRYGNVMASRGSVIPFFIDQIRRNVPITLTDPAMTRFMMKLDDAVDLVLFAFKNARNGDIFVQKAPASTVADIADGIKTLFNVPDHPVKIIGTRHGEKLYETLITREEMVKAEDLGRYYRICSDSRDLNYSDYFDSGEKVITQAGDYHSHNTERLPLDKLVAKLKSLPEIQSDLKEFGII